MDYYLILLNRKYLMKNITKYKSSAVEYYNSISDKYDDLLNTNPLNEKVREEVKRYFLESVTGKRVLDFGGGTGNDLHWLIKAGFDVIFCEPAGKMREIAITNVRKNNTFEKVRFLSNENTDFRSWSKDNLPFKEKTDGVLSNFAVLNSINNLKTLSAKLALITNVNSQLIVIVLGVKAKYLIRNYSQILKSLVMGNGLSVNIQNGNSYLTTYLHRKKNLINSMRKYFEFIKSFPLSDGSFLLLHFVRNEKVV